MMHDLEIAYYKLMLDMVHFDYVGNEGLLGF